MLSPRHAPIPPIQAEAEHNAQSGEAGGTETDGHTQTQNTNHVIAIN